MNERRDIDRRVIDAVEDVGEGGDGDGQADIGHVCIDVASGPEVGKHVIVHGALRGHDRADKAIRSKIAAAAPTADSSLGMLMRSMTARLC